MFPSGLKALTSITLLFKTTSSIHESMDEEVFRTDTNDDQYKKLEDFAPWMDYQAMLYTISFIYPCQILFSYVWSECIQSKIQNHYCLFIKLDCNVRPKHGLKISLQDVIHKYVSMMLCIIFFLLLLIGQIGLQKLNTVQDEKIIEFSDSL